MATNGEVWRLQYCTRCGQLYDQCRHINTGFTTSDDHAARIRARYAIGERFNPDHDTADYTDAGGRGCWR